MLFIILLFILFLYLLLLYGIFRVAFSTKYHKEYGAKNFPKGEQYEKIHGMMEELVDAALKVPFEEVYIKSFDGLRLYGRIYKGDPGQPVEIMFHGWRSNAVRDFAGGAALAREAHDTIILIDERGINNSEGNFLTYGILERKDVLSWIEYANLRFDNPKILLYGISMGAATVLMALDQHLPSNVVGIVADSPYSSPKGIIRKVIKDMHAPVGIAWNLVKQSAFLFGHFNIEESDVLRAVKNSNIPLLIVHGDDDRFVPVEMSEEIKNASGPQCTLEIFKDAAHGVSFIYDEKRYRKVIEDFREEVLR